VKQPIAIVGASTRAAAASAIRAGFLPITADLFADFDLRAIATTTRISPFPEGFVDWLRTTEPPAFMYTGALENHSELVDQMAWIAPLWGNPGDVLERVRNPWELAAALAQAGLLFPETRRTEDGLPLDGTWLAKTYRGASGSGVRSLVGSAESASPPLKDERLCFQRRVTGISAAAVFVAAGGAASLLGLTQQIIGEPWLNSHGFQYSGSIGPLSVHNTTLATINQIGTVLAAHFELIGLFGVDMILSDDGVWTIEVNPRYTASVEIVERATGINAIEFHARACCGVNAVFPTQRAGAFPPSRVKSEQSARPDASHNANISTHAKATLFARQDVTLSEAFIAEALSQALKTPWPTLADISPAGERIEAGRPILTIFVASHNADAAVQALKSRVAEIEHDIYDATE